MARIGATAISAAVGASARKAGCQMPRSMAKKIVEWGKSVGLRPQIVAVVGKENAKVNDPVEILQHDVNVSPPKSRTKYAAVYDKVAAMPLSNGELVWHRFLFESKKIAQYSGQFLVFQHRHNGFGRGVRVRTRCAVHTDGKCWLYVAKYKLEDVQ
ncbi:MAG: hypothetical protein M9918_09990 [Anaerolineae bacterium]|nr:hypothetical protein [Anaerolineae bacterium]